MRSLEELISQATVVGPDDVLVLTFKRALSPEEYAVIDSSIKGSPLEGRVYVVSGDLDLAVVKR